MVRIQQRPKVSRRFLRRTCGILGIIMICLTIYVLPVVAQQTGEVLTFMAGDRVDAVALTADGERLAVRRTR